MMRGGQRVDLLMLEVEPGGEIVTDRRHLRRTTVNGQRHRGMSCLDSDVGALSVVGSLAKHCDYEVKDIGSVVLDSIFVVDDGRHTVVLLYERREREELLDAARELVDGRQWRVLP